MPRKTTIALLGALALAGCGQPSGSGLGASTSGGAGAVSAGLPYLATKNTTRVAGADPVADAAGVAVAVYPGGAAHPQSVALADEHDWRAALVAAELMSPPLRAPLLLSDGGSIPGPTASALAQLHPSQVVRVGSAAKPAGRSTQITGVNPYSLAANVAAYMAGMRNTADNHVLIVSADAPQFAMPAAAWAAKSGDPVLFVTHDSVPPDTRNAIERLQQPRIYVLGPGSVVGRGAIDQLLKLGEVRRIAGPDPVATAIAFARYSSGSFGWSVVNPGHGLVFANASDPLVAPAAAALSASGTYGPLLLLPAAAALPPALTQYLLTIEPGYASDPSRGVYNHGWLIGDANAISPSVQAQIDALLEIAPVNASP